MQAQVIGDLLGYLYGIHANKLRGVVWCASGPMAQVAKIGIHTRLVSAMPMSHPLRRSTSTLQMALLQRAQPMRLRQTVR